MSKDIQNVFDEISANYDAQRRKLIPCFDDFYNIPVAVAQVETATPQVLDIGAGTGLFAGFLLKRYPEARLTLIDISEKMLDVAKLRFKDKKVNYIAADYATYHFTEKYDIIISALSIHHLEDPQKKKLYQTCFDILNPGGLFINADQARAYSPYIEDLNKRTWKSGIAANGLPKAELEACYERMKLDKEAPLDEQLNWLKKAGFSDVDCIYKYYHFVVIFGRKI